MAETERRNLPVAEEPEFSAEIQGINPNDPVHFAQMNAILERLLENDVFLKRLANKMIENSLIAHVLDCENSKMVLGADQGPMITGLIDGVKEDVTQLYSDLQNANSGIRYNDTDHTIEVNVNGKWTVWASHVGTRSYLVKDGISQVQTSGNNYLENNKIVLNRQNISSHAEAVFSNPFSEQLESLKITIKATKVSGIGYIRVSSGNFVHDFASSNVDAYVIIPNSNKITLSIYGNEGKYRVNEVYIE